MRVLAFDQIRLVPASCLHLALPKQSTAVFCFLSLKQALKSGGCADKAYLPLIAGRLDSLELARRGDELLWHHLS